MCVCGGGTLHVLAVDRLKMSQLCSVVGMKRVMALPTEENWQQVLLARDSSTTLSIT